MTTMLALMPSPRHTYAMCVNKIARLQIFDGFIFIITVYISTNIK